MEACAPITDWDDAYANAAHIAGAADYPDAWARDAAAFRATASVRNGVFMPQGTPRGLVVFVHGGYWMRFDPTFWSHLAAGPLARGWAVALPGYTLAPAARIGSITREVAKAITSAAEAVAGPIVLTGHSAGGQLVARMLCDDRPLPAAALGRVMRCVPVSGLFDLRPLLRTAMNATLRLDPEEARAESPALREPVTSAPLIAWVGADERPEFLRQSQLIANVWRGLGQPTAVVAEAGRHHFDVIDGLQRPDSPLTEAIVGGL